MAYYGADLSTVDPNPTIPNTSSGSGWDDVSTIMATAGQIGTSIASVVTGNPVTVNSQGTIVGAAGSTVLGQNQFSGSSMLILLVIVVAIILVVRE